MEETRTRTAQGLTTLPTETVHAIVNPVAGSGRPARAWPAVRRRLESLGLRVEEVHTTEPGAGIALARQLVERGARELLVIGGDGTVNEVVNGCVDAQGQPIGPVTITIVPCGTGRDFPRLFGIVRPEQAVDLLRYGSAAASISARSAFVPAMAPPVSATSSTWRISGSGRRRRPG
jgi:diacylglycerol kinase family enzyme